MRNTTVRIAAATLLLAVWGSRLPAQQPKAADAAKGAALTELNLAAEALKKGDEAKAWQLYAQNADAFVRSWGDLDGALVAWIPDQMRKQKRFKDAITLSDTILLKPGSLKPEYLASIMLTKGDVFRDQENYAAARMEYQGLDRNKSFRDTEPGRRARFRLVDIFRVTKDYESADGMLERLKDSQEPSVQAEAYYYSARIAYDREAYDEARSFIDEVKKRSPEHFETLFLEAELNLKQDRLQDPELEMGSRVLTTYVVPGRPITMKMQDRNLAVVRGGGGIPVQLRTIKGHDEEVVTLSPSPRDPTLFRGSVSTRLGEATTNNMYIEVTGDDIVSYNLLPSFQKLNDLKYEDKKMVVVADGQVTASSADFVTEEDREREMMQAQLATTEPGPAYSRELGRNTSVVRPGNNIYVQVIDPDRDVSGQSDHVFVDVETSSRDLVSAVQLVETNIHSGVFRGKLPTAVAPPKASASDSAPGRDPASAIRTGNSGVWTSGTDAKGPKWFEVDFMTVYPLAEATLELENAAAAKSVTLLGGSDALALRPVADQNPPAEAVYGYVDMSRRFGKTQQGAGYLYTEVTSEGDQDVVLKLGSAGGLACWLNGVRVHRSPDARLWKPEQDVVSAKLKAGVNAILLKVSQVASGPWGASLTIVDASGQPLSSLRGYPPAKPGVVLQWYVFNRLTPEDIQVAERINVQNPVRVGDEQFRWVPTNVTPVASMTVQSNRIVSTFHLGTGVRRLRWVFDGVSPEGSVTVRKAMVTSKFGESIVPSGRDFSSGATNRSLELGPGDRILVKYSDERNTRGAPRVLTAAMTSGFHDAIVSLEYETIGTDADGKRAILYDAALRYRPGITESLVARVVDYDEDTTDGRDKVRVLVQSAAGRQTWLDTIETAAHSGEFIGILKLGATNAVDTIQVGPGDSVTVSYQDRENSDGRVEKSAVVQAAPETPPELILLQNVVLMDELSTNSPGPIVKTRLPPRSEDTNGEPFVVTSLDTALVFKVVYPAAALSENATFPARLVTEREAAAAKAEGREAAGLLVAMRLANPADAEFRAEVPIRTGKPSDYADEADDAEPAANAKNRQREPRTAWLYVRGDDVVRVSVQAAGSDTVREGRYRLASDAIASFADRKYVKPVSEVYVGDYLYLRLSDRDRDVSDGLDEIRVAIVSAAGRVEPAMVETLPHSGLFTCRVKTELAVAGSEAAGAATGQVLRVKHGERVRAEYQDATSVLSSKARTVTATVGLYPGADGALATFTKLFADEEIAVRTRLLMAESLFELAKSHRETNQKDLADKEIAEGKAILEEAILDYPNTTHAPHAEFLLANLAHELENYEEALSRYNKVLSNWPNSEFAARAQLRKGICLEKMNDSENALDAYVELTYSYPNSPLVSDAVIRLGQYFYRTKKYDVAGRIFGNFQARNPEHQLAAKSLFLSGQSYLKGAEERKQELGGRYDSKSTEWLNEAILRFDKLIGSYDDKDLRPEAMYWLADSYMKIKDMKKAYQSLKKLTWDYPESKWAKFARGQLVQNARAFEVYEKEE